MQKNTNKTLILLIILVVITTGAFYLISQLSGDFLTKIFKGPEIISNSAQIVKLFEEKSELKIYTFYLERVIDESRKNSFLWIDFLYPDDKVVISANATIDACINMKQMEVPIVDSQATDEIRVLIPKPITCDRPNVDLSSLKTHVKTGFWSDEFEKKAYKNVQELMEESFKEKNYLEAYAYPAGINMVRDIISAVIPDKKIVVEYKSDSNPAT